jgi:diguanylate cyclase (GGDEF)-like protein
MRPQPNRQPPAHPASARALARTLGQSEHVKELIEESAVELSSVNATLEGAVADGAPEPGVLAALEQSTAVESKVQDASEQLAAVNLALQHEVHERHALEAQLADLERQSVADRHAALHDVLTGLANRALFNDRLAHGVSQARRHGWTLAVLFLDLNGFKLINDTHGHATGDIVLQEIARRLLHNTRADDTVCRHGGDEFVYLLMEVRNERDVIAVATKLLAAVREPCNVSAVAGGLTACVDASIGISMYPRDGITSDELWQRADAAMYHAKRGKSGYAFA